MKQSIDKGIFICVVIICFFSAPAVYPKTNQYAQPSGKNTVGSYKQTGQTYTASHQNSSHVNYSTGTSQQSYNFNGSDAVTRSQIRQNSYLVAYQQPGNNAGDEDSLAPSPELEQASRRMIEAQNAQQSPASSSTQGNLPQSTSPQSAMPANISSSTPNAAAVKMATAKPAQENKWVPTEKRYESAFIIGVVIADLKQKIDDRKALPWYRKLSFTGPNYGGTIAIDGKTYKWSVDRHYTYQDRGPTILVGAGPMGSGSSRIRDGYYVRISQDGVSIPGIKLNDLNNID